MANFEHILPCFRARGVRVRGPEHHSGNVPKWVKTVSSYVSLILLQARAFVPPLDLWYVINRGKYLRSLPKANYWFDGELYFSPPTKLEISYTG